MGERSTEEDWGANVGCINFAIGVDGVAVAEGAIDAPEVHVTLHGTPATTALNQGFGDGPTGVGTDDHDVGLVTLAKKTTIADFEKSSRVVTHEFDKTFEREYALVDELEHRDQGELDHGYATGSTSAATLFLGEEMGGVVSTNRRDAAITKGFTQSIAIALGLNGGIALDASTKSIIVSIAEIEVGDSGFASDKIGGYQLELLGGGDVGNMQMSMVLSSQFDGEAGAGEAGLFAADFGMVDDFGIIAIEALGLGHVTIDDIGILAMSHDGQGGCGEDAL